MSLLPNRIPPQTEPWGAADKDGNVTVGINWYLFLYNLALQVLSQSNGSLASSAIDLTLINDIHSVQIIAKPSPVIAPDDDGLGSDIAQLRALLNRQQALIAMLLDPPQDAIDPSYQIFGVSGTPSGTGALCLTDSPVMTTPNIGAATGASLNIGTGALTAGGIVGTTTNNNAAAGQVGEFIESLSGNVNVTTSIVNLTSITLTAGDWDVVGRVSNLGSGGINAYTIYGISTANNTISGSFGKDNNYIANAIDGTVSVGNGTIILRISLAGSATYYLNAQNPTYTALAVGYLSARRVR